VPFHIAQVAHFRAGRQQHQHPLVDRIHQHNAIAVLLLGDGFARPGGRSGATSRKARVRNRAKRRIDIVRASPRNGESVEVGRFWMRAGIEVERELAVQLLE
jgi:hypothetical protein